MLTEKAVEFELETKPVLSHEGEPELDVPALFRKNKQLDEQPIHESVQKQTNTEEKVTIEMKEVAVTESVSTFDEVEEEKLVLTDLGVEENKELVETDMVGKEKKVLFLQKKR